MLTIYHNPRCSKSRETLELIKNSGKPHEVVLYLENPPAKELLLKALDKLGQAALLRTGEADYKEHFKGKDLNNVQLADLLIQHPKVIERPLVVAGEKMVMGRPPQNVQELL